MIKLTSALVLSIVVSTSSFAQSAEELAKAAQNPIANMISVPLQNNTNGGIGSNDATQNILNVQPVYPVDINDEWLLITRTIVPIVSSPDEYTGEDRVNGIGDTTLSLFVSPKDSSSGVTWGVGPIFLLPTASNDVLGVDKWGAGLSAVALAMPGNWVVGGVVSNLWSVGGSGEADINLLTLQPFVNYNLANGWYLTTAPIITANWEAEDDNRWTVPLGGGVGKIFKIGAQPLNGQISYYNNVERPEGTADWQVRVQLQFLFPK